MDGDDWPDWLPGDWSVIFRKIDGRKVKCFVHPEGHKCYSKPEVLDYLKKMNISTSYEDTQNANHSTTNLFMDPDAPNTNSISESLHEGRPTKLTPRTSQRKSHSWDLSEDRGGSSSKPLSSRSRNGDSSWLPEGWTVELKVRKVGNRSGMKYKCYTDPISGKKFFSKPQVMNHLAKMNGCAGGQEEVFTEPISATPISAWQEKPTTEPDDSQTFEAIEVETNGTGKKRGGGRLSSNYEVISRTPVEGLPAGWIKEVRVRKHGAPNRKDPYYLDPLSEYVFLSKKDALRYLESGDVMQCAMKPMRRDVDEDDNFNANLTISIEELTSPDPSKGTETHEELPNGSVEELKTDESGILNPKPIRSITGGVFNTPNKENSDWLPDGWVVEVHHKQSGAKFKVYKEAASGKKFYSKPQVLNYLAGGNSSNSKNRKLDSYPNSTGADGTYPKRSRVKNDEDCQTVITTTPANGLPPGWIQEIRTKIYATHKRSDPYYIDPVSGYVFRSKLDARRYLETGDVNSCVMRPKVKDKDGKEVFVYTNDAQKPVKPTTANQLFEDTEDELPTENHEQNEIPEPKTADNSEPNVTRPSDPPSSSPAQSSKTQKGTDPETGPTSAGVTEGNGAGQVRQAMWVNLEERPADDGSLCYDMPEADNWTDQCIDFSVNSLATEILFNGQPSGNDR